MNDAKSPQEVKVELSRRIDSLMSELFPSAKRESGGKYTMGSFTGSSGRSCSVYKARETGVYLAKDHATGESTSILELVHRHLGGSFSETMRWAHKFCGFEQIRTIRSSEPKKILNLIQDPMRGTEVARYMMEERNINERTLNKFQIFQHKHNNSIWWGSPLYDEDGDVRMHKYTNLSRTGNSKQIYSTKPVFNTAFGLHLITPEDTACIICEGEIDAMSIYQMQDKDKIPVLSVPSASNHQWIESCYATLSTMETIWIASDMDDAGQSMYLTLSKRLGIERCKRFKIPEPYNDANEWYVGDNPTEELLRKILDESSEQESESLVKPSQYVLQMQDCVTRQESEKEWKNWMFQDMDLSLRQGELFTIVGIPGSGKSQLAYQFANFLADSGVKIMFVSWEIPIESMMLQIAHQKLGREPKHEECAEVAEILGEHMYFVDDTNFKSAKSNWDGLKAEIILAKKKYGIGIVFIDSYTFLAPKMDFEHQGIMAKDLARTCVKNELSIVLLAHADAKNREAGGGKYPPSGPGNILGAQELGQASHTICSMHRNLQKEMAMSGGTQAEKDKFETQGDAEFAVFKQRNSGANFKRQLWFDKKTRMFNTTPTDSSPVKEEWYLED